MNGLNTTKAEVVEDITVTGLAAAEKLTQLLDGEIEDVANNRLEIVDDLSTSSEEGIFLFTGERIKDFRKTTKIDGITVSHTNADDSSSEDEEANCRLKEASVSAEFILSGCSDYSQLYKREVTEASSSVDNEKIQDRKVHKKGAKRNSSDTDITDVICKQSKKFCDRNNCKLAKDL